MEKILYQPWMCPANNAVEHMTHNPKTEGLNPATGIGTDKTAKSLYQPWLYTCSNVVEHMTYIPKIKASKLASDIRRDKVAKKFISTMVVHL